VPGALTAQLRQHRPQHVEGAEDVGLELPPQILVGELLQRAEQSVAGVVDHHVDALERREPVVHRRPGLL
jgi:hypothetical protein